MPSSNVKPNVKPIPHPTLLGVVASTISLLDDKEQASTRSVTRYRNAREFLATLPTDKYEAFFTLFMSDIIRDIIIDNAENYFDSLDSNAHYNDDDDDE